MSEMQESDGFEVDYGDRRRRTVVITGASSGIGRAAARQFARRGYNLALTARSAHTLAEAAEECRQVGVEVLDVPADVTEPRALEGLARQARETFGGIDVWVNNAAVTLFGRFEEVPYEDLRRVIETNLFGYIHGARAALPIFREQGHGVLINVSTANGTLGRPYTSAYTAAKSAVNSLSESLRMELQDAPDIHVCTFLASSVDTPLFQHAANYSGRALQPMPPVLEVDQAARKIVALATHPRRETTVGLLDRVERLARAAAPALMEKAMARRVEQKHFRSAPAPESEGNLFRPVEAQNSASGGWLAARDTYGDGERLRSAALGLAVLGALIGATAWTLTRESPACRQCEREERERERRARRRHRRSR